MLRMNQNKEKEAANFCFFAQKKKQNCNDVTKIK